MKKTLTLIAVAALAGCTSAEQNSAKNEVVENSAEAMANQAAGDEAVASVVTMPDATRNIAFVRAILAAGARCDGVTHSERVKDVNGHPTWRADCKGQVSHLISVSSDGTPQPVFTVNSRN